MKCRTLFECLVVCIYCIFMWLFSCSPAPLRCPFQIRSNLNYLSSTSVCANTVNYVPARRVVPRIFVRESSFLS